MRSSSRFSVSAGLIAALLLVTACSSGSAGGITVSGVWARPSLGSAEPTAAYLTITSTSGQADRLVSVSSPIAGAVEIHQTTTDATGMTGMDAMSGIDIAPGATVTLDPGGMHLMVTGLTKPLKPGDTLELHLVFQRAGTIVVSAEVRQG